ncbi:MAG: VOC family protein [Chitinophagaceae bacterium]|uniref:VOC family protein n=1 Tax=unclassified Paraflavitalea TaxID=2798305 RepID=UPI003D33B0D4|nr:VOC family protein [Chitinophagaceae bacterium]
MHAFFAPQLKIPKGTTDISFYEKGLNAKEIFRFCNDDGSVHVAEFELGEGIFHVHEIMSDAFHSPLHTNSTSVIIGLFVEDVPAVIAQAVLAGATLISPSTDYDYGYRQGEFQDPFGHRWQIQKKIAIVDKME